MYRMDVVTPWLLPVTVVGLRLVLFCCLLIVIFVNNFLVSEQTLRVVAHSNLSQHLLGSAAY